MGTCFFIIMVNKIINTVDKHCWCDDYLRLFYLIIYFIKFCLF